LSNKGDRSSGSFVSAWIVFAERYDFVFFSRKLRPILYCHLSWNEEALATRRYMVEKAFTVSHCERNATLKNGRFLDVVHDYRKATNEFGYYHDYKPYDQNRNNAGYCDFHHPCFLFYASPFESISLLSRFNYDALRFSSSLLVMPIDSYIIPIDEEIR